MGICSLWRQWEEFTKNNTGAPFTPFVLWFIVLLLTCTFDGPIVVDGIEEFLNVIFCIPKYSSLHWGVPLCCQASNSCVSSAHSSAYFQRGLSRWIMTPRKQTSNSPPLSHHSAQTFSLTLYFLLFTIHLQFKTTQWTPWHCSGELFKSLMNNAIVSTNVFMKARK